MTRKSSPSRVASPSRRSRVTPGRSSTKASRRPTSRLNNVDLPTFGRPMMASVKGGTMRHVLAANGAGARLALERAWRRRARPRRRGRRRRGRRRPRRIGAGLLRLLGLLGLLLLVLRGLLLLRWRYGHPRRPRSDAPLRFQLALDLRCRRRLLHHRGLSAWLRLPALDQ